MNDKKFTEYAKRAVAFVLGVIFAWPFREAVEAKSIFWSITTGIIFAGILAYFLIKLIQHYNSEAEEEQPQKE